MALPAYAERDFLSSGFRKGKQVDYEHPSAVRSRKSNTRLHGSG